MPRRMGSTYHKLLEINIFIWLGKSSTVDFLHDADDLSLHGYPHQHTLFPLEVLTMYEGAV